MSPLLNLVLWPMGGRTPFTSYLGRMVSKNIPLSGKQKTSLSSKRTNCSCYFNPLSFIHSVSLVSWNVSNDALTPTHRIMGTCINTNVISHFKMQWQVSADVQNVAVRTQQAVKSFVEQTTIQRGFKPSCVIRGSSHGSCGLWLACSSVIVFKCITMYNVEHT